MRIIPKNTKVSTEFFKGITLADMVVGFIGILIIFLIAVSSLPYRGYIAIGFGFLLVFLLVRIDDESNYMFFFRIIRHFSYFRRYRKAGFEYPKDSIEEEVGFVEEIQNAEERDQVSDMPSLSIESIEEIPIDKFEVKDPLFNELQEEGFEVLDLADISTDKEAMDLPINMLDDYEEKHRKVF